MLKASSLYYAVLVSAIGGLFCSGLILYSSSIKKIEVDSNKVLYHSIRLDNSIRYILSSEDNFSDNIELSDIGYSDIKGQVFKWGVYDLLKVNNSQGREKNVLFGRRDILKEGLYISDNNNVVSFTGNTIVNGDVQLPKGRVERTHILGKHFVGEKLVNGTISNSKKYLPKINEIARDYEISGKESEETMEFQEIIFNSFTHKTEFVNGDLLVGEELKFKGNIIVESKDSIFISSSSVLENVIIKSPIIHIESGFKGKVQLMGSKRITIEDMVELQYPSAIVLDKKVSASEGFFVSIGKESKVSGVLIGLESKKDFRNELRVSLEESSLFQGCIYNTGSTELKGKVIGHVVSNRLHYHSSSSSYKSVLVDAIIDGQNLDTNFLFPNMFIGEKSKYKVISYLE